jgi:stage V sporulation protein G
MCQNISLSEIQILPVKPNNGLVAFASFILNGQFYIGNVAIYTTPDGFDYRLVYPAKILPNGKQINIFHPITREAGEVIKFAVLEKYRALIMDIEAEKVAKK